MSSSPYAPAGNMLNKLWKTRKGLKTIAYNSKGELTCSKTTYAQCAHVLQHKPLLDAVLKQVPTIEAKNKGLLYVLVYELLLGPNKAIRGGGALKRLLIKHQPTLESEIKELGGLQAATFQDIVTIPRYVRINTLLSPSNDILNKLKGKEKISDMYMDPHVPDVLVLPPTASSREQLQDLVTSHQVVLQDKSSCFSALCLVHGFDTPIKGDVLDACAAPGNKTSHVAALHTKSKIHACDKSKDRFELLQRRMRELTTPQSSKKSKVGCYNVDFLSTNPSDNKEFSKVAAILLDPSCSGSGMTLNHQGSTLNRDPSYSSDRIKSLSNFQFQALQHATSNFPKVNRVVYSTCSVYLQENEGVVQRLLESNEEWELVAPKCLEHWKRRGHHTSETGLTKEQTDCLIRVNPEEDATNGFFVACFQRKNLISSKRASLSYSGPILPQGMEFYDNHFDQTGKKVKEEEGVGPSPQKSSESGSKRKSEENSATISSKKRAKKLAWKQKQREKKLERQQKQQKDASK